MSPILRLNGDLFEELQLVVQDNLTAAEISKLQMIAQGHELN